MKTNVKHVASLAVSAAAPIRAATKVGSGDAGIPNVGTTRGVILSGLTFRHSLWRDSNEESLVCEAEMLQSRRPPFRDSVQHDKLHLEFLAATLHP